MDKFLVKMKEKKIAVYVMALLFVMLVVIVAVFFYGINRKPKEPIQTMSGQKFPKEKTEKEIIQDLTVPVPGFQEKEVSEDVVKSLTVPVKNSSEGEKKDQPPEDKIIESLTKPVK